MTEQQMWNDARTIKSLIGKIPDWLDEEHEMSIWMKDHGPLTPADVAAINQGGCESGAFMPAVTYWSAKSGMSIWGDEIFAYIEDRLGDVPAPDDKNRQSWGTLACFYVSVAVELWAADTLAALEDIDIAED